MNAKPLKSMLFCRHGLYGTSSEFCLLCKSFFHFVNSCSPKLMCNLETGEGSYWNLSGLTSHSINKNRFKMDFPWWSSGWDSTLTKQGVMGSIPGQLTGIPRAAWYGQNIKKRKVPCHIWNEKSTYCM